LSCPVVHSASEINWTDYFYEDKQLLKFGGILRRHCRATTVKIRCDPNDTQIRLLNDSMKSLTELKWCTHLYWIPPPPSINTSYIGSMTSLRVLYMDQYGGDSQMAWQDDESQLPLECLPDLESLTMKGLSLNHLSRIRNPLKLHTLAITNIYDWNGSDEVFHALLRFTALRTLRLGRTGEQYHIRQRLAALMLRLTQLQRLCIDPIAPSLSKHELKLSPSSWGLGTPPSSLTDIRYYEPDGDLSPLLVFGSLSKLELDNPQHNWKGLKKLAPQLISLTLGSVILSTEALESIATCTRLTSLRINGGNTSGLFNLDVWKHLPLKTLMWHNVGSRGNLNKRPSSIWLYESICKLWSNTLTELTIATFGEKDYAPAGSIKEQIDALISLRVIERLIFTDQAHLTDKDLITLATHPRLPSTLKHVSWQWARSSRRGAHHHVRQAFTKRNIMCHTISTPYEAVPP
jgi:hypothetical protein